MAGRIVRVDGKMYDTKTPNKSFQKVALDLKRAGVKNWYFLLEIKDPNLITFDPHQIDEKTGKCTLSKNQIEHVMFECTNNAWYYLREVARIEESGLANGVPYRANRGNIAQAWCLLHGIDSWLCLPRQQGKTISALALITWVYSFGTKHSTFIFVNKDGDNAKENLRRVCGQIDLLPEYLRFESVMLEEDENGKRKLVKARKNATMIEQPVTKNKIVTKARATSYSNALGMARGMTAPLIHFDESEFTDHIKTIVENSLSTFQTAADISKANGAIYGRIFTSTPSPVSLGVVLVIELGKLL